MAVPRIAWLAGLGSLLAIGASPVRAQDTESKLAAIERRLEKLQQILEGVQEALATAATELAEVRKELADLKRSPGTASRGSKIGINESSAIGTLRSLTTAEEQFKQQGIVDQDGDGSGEYGWLGELSGMDPTRGMEGVAGPKMSTSPFIASILGVKDASGYSQKSGYYYRLFLPGAGAGPSKAETQAHAGTGSTADADNQEVRWACYAWPAKRGETGNRAFYAGHQGEVYGTAATRTQYSGTTIVPKAHAALDTGGPNPENLDAGIGLLAAGLTSGDGNVWVPAGN